MTLEKSGICTGEKNMRSASSRRLLRAVRRTAFVLACLMLAYLGGFVAFATHVAGMMPPQEPRAADAIIVFTGGHFRLEPALELLRSGKGRRLLISGVHPDANISALRRATGAEAPLFDCCIDIDHEALDTAGNAEETAKWLSANHFSSAILVTNNYHVPRSLVEMRRRAANADLEVYPVVNSRIDGLRWLASRDVLRVLLTEYSKYIAAIGKGIVGV